MTDNELIEKFFQEARQAELADDGFSERVMQRLPAASAVRREQLASRLWTLLCVTVATVLFVALRGWDAIAYGLLMLVNTPPTQQQLLVFVASAVVVGLLALSEMVSRERYSVL